LIVLVITSFWPDFDVNVPLVVSLIFLALLSSARPFLLAQLGHVGPKFTLRVYTHQVRRGDGERERLRLLVGGRRVLVHEPVVDLANGVLVGPSEPLAGDD
jgi:hypothetical protein